MKVSGGAVVAASAAATVASCAAAISSSAPYPVSSDSNFHSSCQNGGGSQRTAAERYAPRFDGLRFIETLVTAHR